MEKGLERKIKEMTKFMSNEFLVELANDQFNFKRAERELAEDLADYSDFEKSECQTIAKQVTKRLRTFANAIQTAQAATIQ